MLIKRILLVIAILFFCGIFNLSFAQYKIVRLESENLYFRYYYNSDTSDEYKDDSTYFLCIKKGVDTVSIVKFVNSMKIWEDLFTIRKAKQKMSLKQRNRDKIKLIYRPYYIAYLIKQ